MATSEPAVDTAPATTANPRVWMDVSVDGTRAGRIVFELFADAVPKCVRCVGRPALDADTYLALRTAENFRALCPQSAAKPAG